MTYIITEKDVDEIFNKINTKKFLLNIDKTKITDLIKIRNEIITLKYDEEFIIDQEMLDNLNIKDTDYLYLNYKNILEFNVTDLQELIDFNKNCNLKNDIVKIYSVIEDYDTFDEFCYDFIKNKNNEIKKQKEIEMKKKIVEQNKLKRDEIKELKCELNRLKKIVEKLNK